MNKNETEVEEDTELDEIDELAAAMEEGPPRGHEKSGHDVTEMPEEGYPTRKARKEEIAGQVVQWTCPSPDIFVPSGPSVPKLEPGIYDINMSPSLGLFFQKVKEQSESLIRFKDNNIELVLDEITTFWEREDRYLRYRIPYKRGILLWGPQGTGKSCFEG